MTIRITAKIKKQIEAEHNVKIVTRLYKEDIIIIELLNGKYLELRGASLYDSFAEFFKEIIRLSFNPSSFVYTFYPINRIFLSEHFEILKARQELETLNNEIKTTETTKRKTVKI